MNDLKSPVSRLARLFRDARDRWRAKALERQQRLRAAQVRIRDLEHSRSYWKERALAAEGRALASGVGDGETDAKASENTTGSPAVAECVTRTISRFRFNPGPDGGSVTFRYPFVFQPQN